MNRKTFYIVEPSSSGHRLFYVARVIKACRKSKLPVVVVTTPSTAQSAAFQVVERVLETRDRIILFNELKESGKTRWLFTKIRLLTAVYQWFKEAAASARLEQDDAIFVIPYLDYISSLIPFLGSPFKSDAYIGICMRVDFHHASAGLRGKRRWSDLVKRWIFFALLKDPQLASLITIDPLLKNASDCSPGSRKVRYVADPAKLHQISDIHAASSDQHREGNPVVLVYGSLSSRKGIRYLLEAIKDLGEGERVIVKLCGRQDEDVKSLLEEPWIQELVQRRLLEIKNGFISEEEETLLFAKASVVWLGYVGHYGSSGVLGLAAHAQKPVLSCRDGLIGWETVKFSLGVVCDPLSGEQVREGLREVLMNPLRFTRHLREYADLHSEEAFIRKIRSVFEEVAT